MFSRERLSRVTPVVQQLLKKEIPADMRIAVFLNQLGIGGSEKAACIWSRELSKRRHEISVVSLADGPRRAELESYQIDVRIAAADQMPLQQLLEQLRPDVIHVHVPGHSHKGDVLGEALAQISKIPVVQTNIFGQLNNPKENAWTDFRLFISWTSCVQAARRSFQSLDRDFFRRASVAVYPLYPDVGPSVSEIESFRASHGIRPDEVLFGRLSRPEPNKWTDLALEGFRIAMRQDPRFKLLLREPPPAVAQSLASALDHDRFVVLPATSDPLELAQTMASLDVVLHTSSVGESFGYGVAEPMNYAKPVIANSTPWQDQAQIELVRHGECGFVASTAQTIADAMLKLANDAELRTRFGKNAQIHIRKLTDPAESTDRLEDALRSASTGRENPRMFKDVTKAKTAADYLDRHQFGHSWREQLALRPSYYRARFHEWRRRHKFSFSRTFN